MTTAETAKQAARREIREGLRALFAQIWQAAKQNRGLIALIFALGIANAAITKAPLLLLQPLTTALNDSGEAGLDGLKGFNAWFQGVAESLCGLIGYAPIGPHADALKICVACAMIAALLGLIGGPVIYGSLLTTRYFATKVVVDLRNQIAAHLLRLPLGFYGRQRMGDLLSSITNDTATLTRSFQLAADNVIMDPWLVIANMVVIVVTVPQAVWLVVLMVPMMALPLIRMGRKIHKTSRQSLSAMGDATESMNQMLTGIKTVKAFQLEERRLAEFEASNSQYLNRTKKMLSAKAVGQGTTFALYQVGFAAMLGLSAWVILAEGHELGQILVVLAAVSTTYTHVKRLSRAYNTLMESSGAMARIQIVLDEEVDVGVRAALANARPAPKIEGRVEFDAVDFAFADEPVLRGVSFTIEPGQTVALVGPSGAGKSTSLDLLARFYDPSQGAIRVDGHDLRELELSSYRAQLAIVGQQPFLFNTSIAENILCARPGASHDDMVAAARAAQIHDFIVTLPEGYGSVVGERGSNLSGGQMQRITIARAILRDPAILILDEATSALDAESEEAVQQALSNLMQNRTSLVIAHRLASVTSADNILVFDKGRIVDSGSHNELVKRDGLYARLSKLQDLGQPVS